MILDGHYKTYLSILMWTWTIGIKMD